MDTSQEVDVDHIDGLGRCRTVKGAARQFCGGLPGIDFLENQMRRGKVRKLQGRKEGVDNGAECFLNMNRVGRWDICITGSRE